MSGCNKFLVPVRWAPQIDFIDYNTIHGPVKFLNAPNIIEEIYTKLFIQILTVQMLLN